MSSGVLHALAFSFSSGEMSSKFIVDGSFQVSNGLDLILYATMPRLTYVFRWYEGCVRDARKNETKAAEYGKHAG